MCLWCCDLCGVYLCVILVGVDDIEVSYWGLYCTDYSVHLFINCVVEVASVYYFIL